MNGFERCVNLTLMSLFIFFVACFLALFCAIMGSMCEAFFVLQQINQSLALQ